LILLAAPVWTFLRGAPSEETPAHPNPE
jgi:hypothetical protein